MRKNYLLAQLSKEQQLARKTGVDEVVSKDSAVETTCRHETQILLSDLESAQVC